MIVSGPSTFLIGVPGRSSRCMVFQREFVAGETPSDPMTTTVPACHDGSGLH
ncbi:MAG: hypothetical protein ABR512_03145 [Desulfopila sp.]